MRTLYALTVHQPWATWILLGGKDVENRCWRAPTAMIGQVIAIHAGRQWDADAVRWAAAHCIHCVTPDDRVFPQGQMLGTVRLVSCVRDHESAWAIRGQWHWVLSDPTPARPKFPLRGFQRLWRVPTQYVDGLLAVRKDTCPVCRGTGAWVTGPHSGDCGACRGSGRVLEVARG